MRVFTLHLCTPQVAQWWKIHLPTQETQVRTLGQEDPLEEENGNSLQYSLPENPKDRGVWRAIESMGSQRVGHDSTHTRPLTFPFNALLFSQLKGRVWELATVGKRFFREVSRELMLKKEAEESTKAPKNMRTSQAQEMGLGEAGWPQDPAMNVGGTWVSCENHCSTDPEVWPQSPLWSQLMVGHQPLLLTPSPARRQGLTLEDLNLSLPASKW